MVPTFITSFKNIIEPTIYEMHGNFGIKKLVLITIS
jgi:hypothetical protein